MVKVCRICFGVLGFLVFLILTAFFAPVEFIYVYGSDKLCRLMGATSEYPWTVTPALFKMANFCYDWSGLPD